jgi:hypothetical protein
MIFYGTNYAGFAANICVHMRSLCLECSLWQVSCPPRPIALIPFIAGDASEADRVAAKTADDAAVDAYDQ